MGLKGRASDRITPSTFIPATSPGMDATQDRHYFWFSQGKGTSCTPSAAGGLCTGNVAGLAVIQSRRLPHMHSG